MAARKLQLEIDRTLKKVTEGVEVSSREGALHGQG
jgi:hypothetical protein